MARSSIPARWLGRVGALVLLTLLATGATCDGSGGDTFAPIDAGPSGDTQADTSIWPEAAEVPIELEEYVDTERTGSASLYQVTSEDELATGPVVEARVGDWVLENERVRLFVETDERAMSPCPWGGNIVDAQYKRADGTTTEDVVGEICLMINIGQTFAPERFDVIRDGSRGGPAILAISGRLELLDFLNITSMVGDYAPGLLDRSGIEPDTIIDAKLTRYFILHPGENGLQVVTALRNDGDEMAHMTVGHLMRGGAHGNYFNPLNSTKGWGYSSLGPENIAGDALPFVAFSGPKGGYAYVPEPDLDLFDVADELPRGGVQVSVAGVAVSLLGRNNVLNTLLADEERIKTLDGLLHLEPGQMEVMTHWEFFGDGQLSTMVDPIYAKLGVDPSLVRGQVTDADGQPVAGATVTAIDDESDRGMNQAVTDDEGRYTLQVPAGAYRLKARLDGQVGREEPSVTLDAGGEAQADLQLKAPATIDLVVRTPAGAPTPARVSVLCEGPCPDMPTTQERDVTLDAVPDGFSRIVSVGVDGQASIDLPAGAYRVVVSRGMEWSLWPSDAHQTGGELVELAEGESIDLSAEIARVVDTTGALGADFHVHGVTSPDSVVRKQDRVLNFMGEGVDVLISTDHDFISDYGPSITELGAGDQIASIVGEEITTPTLGHFNAFPLIRDPQDRRGGALDWARGTQNDMTPAEIFAWVDAQDGNPDNAQVKQINHPGSTIGPLQADPLRGITLADRADKRLAPQDNPNPDDTGLWSDEFTAIEMMNGHGMDGVWSVMRWWLQMVSRGFSPTATAVTDTHKLYQDLGGSPRSFVFVGEANDRIDTFDEQAFAAAANESRLVGSNGPFFRVELENSSGQTASLGDTLAASDGQATARVSIELPEWIEVDTVDVYSNLSAEAIMTAPGEAIEDPIAPTSTHAIEWAPEDLVEAASGTTVHRHRTKTVEIPMTFEADAYVVIVVRASADGVHMWPVLPDREVKPFAFANPVFVDVDGNGYDNPPLADLAQTPLEPQMLRDAAPKPFEGELEADDIEELLHRYGHQH